MAYVIDDQLKEAVEAADWEKALKDVAMAIAKDKSKEPKAAEKRAQASEKLGSTKLKLVEAKSMNLTQADEISDLKAALVACEDKWYNVGFEDMKNSVEPMFYQAQRHRFEEGWIAALQAMEVSTDSPLRNPEQIPFLEPPTPVQDPSGADEEDIPSMKELVRVINSHVKSTDLEVTSNFDAALHVAPLPHPNCAGDTQTVPYSVAQPARDATNQPTEEIDLAKV